MKEPNLHIFAPENPELLSFEITYVKEGEGYAIREHELKVSEDTALTIYSSISSSNLAYSIAVKSNNKNQFSVMGIKQSKKSSDPCIMYTTENGLELQIAINI